ncbi:[NiFe]-hydrogenase assembly chaperone HybE [Azospirillum thermophilum]|uniref:[NiFe]-hydrogenase assembly, chaperone, HybE n=1 Tax=Azospirillum thermophilum TaxID=2202148 RepID=A0A2S2CYX1_9PROT|nr:[NiFe]-hydrogenase assembly chaperone HybE [Azospirillum thermophilum]AWK89714.1 [NiFe]-hydrogenase assembly, chaperone, HybE [Azospirillum thermophilum]
MTAPFPAGRFEGSYLGDASRIGDATRMECKICWHVYDPAEGCEVWQVPPGTPFAALPEEWRCPVCDGARDQFMSLDAGTPAPDGQPVPLPASPLDAPPDPVTAETPARPAEAIRALEAVFREIYIGQMRGIPIVNDALAVKAVGFRAWNGHWLGALVTPWFMNLVLLPGGDDDWSGLTPGAKELVEFPSGFYEFLHADRAGVGPYKACSLFSPMFEFTTMLQATETAAAALVALFDPSIREDGARTGEIRRLREAELAPPPEDPAATGAPAAGEAAVEGEEVTRPSRRAVLTFQRAS